MAELLGDDHARNGTWRDHGLVEFFGHRASGRDSWAGEHFSAQAHYGRSGDLHSVISQSPGIP